MREASPIQSVLIDARELARMLAVSVPTIWRWKEAKKLPPEIKLSAQCVRWKRATVEAWLNSLDVNNNGPGAGTSEPSVIRQSPIV